MDHPLVITAVLFAISLYGAWTVTNFLKSQAIVKTPIGQFSGGVASLVGIFTMVVAAYTELNSIDNKWAPEINAPDGYVPYIFDEEKIAFALPRTQEIIKLNSVVNKNIALVEFGDRFPFVVIGVAQGFDQLESKEELKVFSKVEVSKFIESMGDPNTFKILSDRYTAIDGVDAYMTDSYTQTTMGKTQILEMDLVKEELEKVLEEGEDIDSMEVVVENAPVTAMYIRNIITQNPNNNDIYMLFYAADTQENFDRGLPNLEMLISSIQFGK